MIGARAATPEDVPEIARIHVDTWRAAYRGVVPDEYLASLSAERRAQMWTQIIAQPGSRVWVVEREGSIVGFAAGGPARDDDLDHARVGEIGAIYVLPDHWGSGAGSAVFTLAVDDLRSSFEAATLWVLEDNPRARRFYEREGWRLDGTRKIDDFAGAPLAELRYRIDFDDGVR